ncbi:MAG: Tfp pilus assembly protein FimT/FimU [Parahaliea sp.]
MTWVTGADMPGGRRAGGFTLLELMAALVIAGLVLAVAVPAAGKMYESMRYRQAVRDVINLLASARYQAVTSGQAQDLEVIPQERRLKFADGVHELPSGFKLAVHSAKSLNRGSTGIIRFYPEGGTSGGGVDIESPTGKGLSIRIDWLMGGVTQEPYAVQ